MSPADMIQCYHDASHRTGTVALWKSVFAYETPHNEPNLSIDMKIGMDDGLFWVAVNGDEVIGSVMAGWDGHRGWLYSLAVLPEWQGRGLGSVLVKTAEAALVARGCMKINLQVRGSNQVVTGFYEVLGYSVEPSVSMGKLVG